MFLQEDLQLLKSFRFDCMAKQILWNPIESNIFAICFDDGSLTVYLFDSKDQYGMKTIVKAEVRYVVPRFKYYCVGLFQ